jgi:hypothetical protein
MEITQSAQCYNHPSVSGGFSCEDNAIPLIARRYTWIRLYVRAFNSQQDIQNVPVRLFIERNGQEYATLDGSATAWALPINRDDINATANFMLFCDVCLINDTLAFQAYADPDNTLADPDRSNNVFPRTDPLSRVLVHRWPLRITVVPFTFKKSGKTANVPPAGDLLRLITRAFPVNHSPAVNLIDAPPFPYPGDDRNGCIDGYHHGGGGPLYQLETAWLAANKVKPRDQVVGLLPEGPCFDGSPWNLVASPLFAKGRGSVSLLAHYGGDYYYNRTDRLMAEGIGANLGRRSPCTLKQDPDYPQYYNAVRGDPGWPYPFEPARITQTGIETDATIVWVWIFPIAAYQPVSHPGSQTDLMQRAGDWGTNCNGDEAAERWVSPYTYSQLACALSFHGPSSYHCRQGNVGNLIGVGLDASDSNPASTPDTGPALVVSGLLNSDGTGEIESVWRLDDAEVDEPSDGEFCIEAAGTQASTAPRCWDNFFEPVPDDPSQLMPSSFTILLPWQDGTDTVVLRKGAAQLDLSVVSANAPTARRRIVERRADRAVDSGRLRRRRTQLYSAVHPRRRHNVHARGRRSHREQPGG